MPDEYRTFQLVQLGVSLTELGYPDGLPGHLGDWFLKFAQVENEVRNDDARRSA